jgi:hypothetical protein
MGKSPQVIVVGSDKGGVGKTTVTRALLDYLKSAGIEHRAFDTESPEGDLKRFYPAKAKVVDFANSDGQMQILDTLGEAITVIDIRAGLLSPTLKTLSEIGFIDPARCSLIVLHVLGNTQSSINEVKVITDKIATARYVAIGNRINDTKFDFPAGALDVPMLNARACEAVDAASVPFSVFVDSDASSVLRGYVKFWLGLVFQQFDAARLAQI